MMRELVIILVQAITDLFNCVPKDSRGTERALRIEATLAEPTRDASRAAKKGRARIQTADPAPNRSSFHRRQIDPDSPIAFGAPAAQIT